MSMSVVRELPEESWRNFVDQHPQGNIFHTPEIFQTFKQTQDYEPELWAVTDGEQVLALMLPVRIIFMNGPLRSFTARAVAHGGVLYAPDTTGVEALSLLLESYTQEVGKSLLFTAVYETASVPSAQPPLFQHGFSYEPSMNYLLDLSRSPDDILQGMKRRMRKQLRAALRKGEVVVEEVTERDQVAIVYDLVRQSCEYGKHPLADISLFEAVFDILRPKGLGKLLLAKRGETPVASSVELPYKESIFGWYGGMDRAHASCAANEQVYWHIFRWGAEYGYNVSIILVALDYLTNSRA